MKKRQVLVFTLSFLFATAYEKNCTDVERDSKGNALCGEVDDPWANLRKCS